MAEISVLFVENDMNKAKRVIDYLEKLSEVTVRIVHKSSYHSGLKELLAGQYDFLLLDMSLPVFERSQSERAAESLSLGGQELLQQMKRRALTTPVVVITQYETFGEGEERKSLSELKKIVKRDYPRQYRGFVYYNASLDSWKDELKGLLTKH